MNLGDEPVQVNHARSFGGLNKPLTLNYACSKNAGRQDPRKTALAVLVAVALFSLAAACVAPSLFATSGPHTRVDRTRAIIGGLSTCFELYRQNVGVYPAFLDDLTQLPGGITQENWRGPYVENSSKLRDDWGQPLRYRFPGVKNVGRYDLWSAGKDGVDGTADDIRNWP